ncbi:MAG TPA: efflux RND transporter periplasmic adaptor subunit [Candidatus Paceibacterota bacterium]|nr:efflux RND transporter periplasmic adaptor subunit [Candidatus Paceibacterota bacterium]
MKAETHAPKRSARQTWIITGIAVFMIAALAGGFIYLEVISKRVYIDTSSVQAPEIDLAPSDPGILENVYVNVGDEVPANTTVARVGNELIQTKVAGIIISTSPSIGQEVNANTTVVAMIDPTQLRVVGEVDENKGLSRIQVGDPVVFTVDAFGSKQFSGVVDEVSPTAQATQVVFNISDQREEQQFDVKARFDTSAYPELKNGMSARMWVYVN